jgi:hypothetical protein
VGDFNALLLDVGMILFQIAAAALFHAWKYSFNSEILLYRIILPQRIFSIEEFSGGGGVGFV